MQTLARDGSKRLPDVIALIAVTAAVLWAYAAVRTFPFVSYDDPTYVVRNPWVQTGLSWEGLRWALGTLHFANWHPLTWLSYMLDAELFGADPAAMHVVNVVLHVGNAWLVYAVLRQLGASVPAAAFVAGVFALHPLQVESVVWISQRKGLLGLLFGLLSLSSYVRWTRSGSRTAYLLSVLLLGLGLSAKAMLVTWPALLLLFDYALHRIDLDSPLAQWRDRALEKLPHLALAGAAAVLAVLAQRSGQALIDVDVLPLTLRLQNAVVAYAAYLGKIVWPVGLAPLYPHPTDGIPILRTVGCALLMAGVSLALLWPLRRHRVLLVGWLWYGIALLPVIGIVQIGGQALADRYVYLPLLGIVASLTWLAARALRSWPALRPWLVAAAVATLVTLSMLTGEQVDHWRSSRALFEHTLSVTERNFVAHLHLGSAWLEEENSERAIEQYLAAEAVVAGHPLARLGLAAAYQRAGQVAEARAWLEPALKRHPDWPEGHVTLGNLHLDLGDLDASWVAFGRALEIAPGLASAHNGMGVALARAGDPQTAIVHFEHALRLDPGFVQARRNLEMARRAANPGHR